MPVLRHQCAWSNPTETFWPCDQKLSYVFTTLKAIVLLNGLLDYCSCCSVLYIQPLLTIHVCAITLQKCQESRHSGCAGRTSSIDLYLSVQAEPLLLVQSLNPTLARFQIPDSHTLIEDPACSHASEPPVLMFHSPSQNLAGKKAEKPRPTEFMQEFGVPKAQAKGLPVT